MSSIDHTAACFKALHITVQSRDAFFNDDRLGLQARARKLSEAYPNAVTIAAVEVIDQERLAFSSVRRRVT